MEGKQKASIDVGDDLRQAVIVGRYEILKFFYGKKIFIFGGLILALYALVTWIMFAFADQDMTVRGATQSYISFLQLLLLIGATLFSSVTIVSEFEGRTALTLFTKPVRKYSIVIGKFCAAYVLNLGIVLLYFVLSAVAVAIKTGGVASEMAASFGYCALYAFSLTGIALFFSALMKKSSSASILTFIFILMAPMVIAMVAVLAMDIDPSEMWYVLDVASAAVVNCFDGPIANPVRDSLVMVLWGLVPAVAGYFLFRRREV